MPVADYAQNVKTPFFPMVRHAMDWSPAKPGAATTAAAATPASTTTKTASTGDGDHKSFWQDVLDVVNPLQHLPIVGTIYRAITHDKIGDVEKVAGDTLYGGPVGLASSLVDVAFEKITGKDFGDTVMDLIGLGGSDKDAAPASTLKPLPARTNVAAAVAPIAATPATMPVTGAPTAITPEAKPADGNTQALMSAMSQNGVDPNLGMRALYAYQRSLTLKANPDGGIQPAP